MGEPLCPYSAVRLLHASASPREAPSPSQSVILRVGAPPPILLEKPREAIFGPPFVPLNFDVFVEPRTLDPGSSEARKRESEMAKKITGYIKLQVPAGAANPAPPIGPALGQR